MAVDVSPLLTFNPENVGIPEFAETFLFTSITLSSTVNVDVLIVVVVPSTVKSPCTLTPASVIVISVFPSTVTVTDPSPESATVTLVLFCVMAVDDIPDISLSTYALIDCCVANLVLLFDAMLSSSLIPVTVAPSPAILIEVAASNAPVMSTASAIVTLVESDESRVVPLILNELNNKSPVPLGCIESSAFDPLDAITLVVIAPTVAVPRTVGAEIVGLVKVLLVIVCVPESLYALVTTSPSPDGADVLRPVIVLAEADNVISPHSRPLLTLKLRVVMVHSPT